MIPVGHITAPSGQLLVIAPFELSEWGRRPPQGTFYDPVPNLVDLFVDGRGRERVSRELELASKPHLLFDLAPERVDDQIEELARLTRAAGLGARFRRLRVQLTPRQRVELLLPAGNGACALSGRRISGAAVDQMPAGKLLVLSEAAEGGGPPRTIVRVRDGEVAASELVARLLAFRGVFVLIDSVAAAEHWTDNASLTGKADVFVRGPDAAGLLSSMPPVGGFRPHPRGWLDIPLWAATIHENSLRWWKTREGLDVDIVLYAHSHMYRLVGELERPTPCATVIEVGSSLACAVRPAAARLDAAVYRDSDALGRAMQIRIESL